MSIHYGNTQFAEATIPELELNKETLQDLEVDGSQVKGGGGVYVAGPAVVAPGTIRMTVSSGTSVISISLNPSGG